MRRAPKSIPKQFTCILDDGSADNYTRGSFLGNGNYAMCYEVIHDKSGSRYAGKFMNLDVRENLLKEYKKLKSVDHAHVVRAIKYIKIEAEIPLCCILLELCNINVSFVLFIFYLFILPES